MIPPDQIAEVRRLYYAEHWKIGTIAAQLGRRPRPTGPTSVKLSSAGPAGA